MSFSFLNLSTGGNRQGFAELRRKSGVGHRYIVFAQVCLLVGRHGSIPTTSRLPFLDVSFSTPQITISDSKTPVWDHFSARRNACISSAYPDPG